MARILTIAAVVAGLGAAPVWADGSTNAVFNLAIRGLSAGSLTIKGNEQGGSYATTGVLQSGGLVGLVARLKYTASARGRVNGARFQPSRYDENRAGPGQPEGHG